MKYSTQIRFGRKGDKQALLEGAPIFGSRRLRESLRQVLKPHTLPRHQVFVMLEGSLDLWVSGTLWQLSAGEMLLIQPYETVAFLEDSIPPGVHYFLQFDIDQIENDQSYSQEHQQIALEVKRLPTRRMVFKARLTQLLKQFITEHQHPGRWSGLYCRQWLLEILTLILEAEEDRKYEPPLMIKVRKLLSQRQAGNWHICELAQRCELSEHLFRSLFTDQAGCCPQQFLRAERFRLARRLLLDAKIALAEISDELDFSSVQHFSLFIRQFTGLPPGRYRKALKQMQSSSFLSAITGREAAKELDIGLGGEY